MILESFREPFARFSVFSRESPHFVEAGAERLHLYSKNEPRGATFAISKFSEPSTLNDSVGTSQEAWWFFSVSIHRMSCDQDAFFSWLVNAPLGGSAKILVSPFPAGY